MDAVERVLAMLGSIAGILSVVVAIQHYRSDRQPPDSAPYGGSRGEPPAVVRAFIVWLVVMTLIALCAQFAVYTVILENLAVMVPKARPVSDEFEIIGPALLVAVTGMIMLPLAISWGARLRRGESTIRTKLLGVVAADLCAGFFVVVLAFVVGRSLVVPAPVLAVAATYVGFGVISGLTSLTLLLHPDTRRWVTSGPHVRAG